MKFYWALRSAVYFDEAGKHQRKCTALDIAESWSDAEANPRDLIVGEGVVEVNGAINTALMQCP